MADKLPPSKWTPELKAEIEGHLMSVFTARDKEEKARVAKIVRLRSGSSGRPAGSKPSGKPAKNA